MTLGTTLGLTLGTTEGARLGTTLVSALGTTLRNSLGCVEGQELDTRDGRRLLRVPRDQDLGRSPATDLVASKVKNLVLQSKGHLVLRLA